MLWVEFFISQDSLQWVRDRQEIKQVNFYFIAKCLESLMFSITLVLGRLIIIIFCIVLFSLQESFNFIVPRPSHVKSIGKQRVLFFHMVNENVDNQGGFDEESNSCNQCGSDPELQLRNAICHAFSTLQALEIRFYCLLGLSLSLSRVFVCLLKCGLCAGTSIAQFGSFW